MSRIGFATYDKAFAVVYLILGTSIAFTLTSLPFFAVLYLFSPEDMWLITALTAITLFPSFSASFGVFTDFVTNHDHSILSGYFRHWARSLWRSTLIGFVTVACFTVLVVDFVYLWQTQTGALFAPITLMGAAIVLTVGIGSLAVDKLAPSNSLIVLIKATFYVTIRRFYITAVSWLGMALAAVVILTHPAIGLGALVAPALFLFWSNTKYCLNATISKTKATTVA